MAKAKATPKTKKVVKTLSNAQIEFINGADSVLCYNAKNKVEFFCQSAEEARAFFSFNTVTRHNVHFGISYPSTEAIKKARDIITARTDAAKEAKVETVQEADPFKGRG